MLCSKTLGTLHSLYKTSVILFYAYMKVKVAQLCPTLYDLMDNTVHVVLQARILEWVAIHLSGDVPNPGIETKSPALQADSLLPVCVYTYIHICMYICVCVCVCEKASLKYNIHNTKIIISRLPTSWQIEGQKVETVTDFIFLGSKITVDGDCSHEIKSRLAL